MARYTHNIQQNGIEIYFEKRPDTSVLNILKNNKWRWNPKKSCWYNRYSTENMRFAKSLCDDEIRDVTVINDRDRDDNLVKGRLEEPLEMGSLEPPPVMGADLNFIDGQVEPFNDDDYDKGDPFLISAISEIINNYGLELFQDNRRARNIISDYLLDRKKELNVVKVAIQEGVINRIIDSVKKPEEQQRRVLDACINYMADGLGMNYETSGEVLLCFQAAVNKFVYKSRGKSTCHQLKEMRRRFASANGISYTEEDCTYDGPCEGTCPYCDGKTKELNNKVKELGFNAVYPKTDLADIGLVHDDDLDDGFDDWGLWDL